MKIALLTASVSGGGAERVQITLAKELAQLGHRVYLIAFVDDGGPLRNEVPKEVCLVNFGVSRVAQGIFPLAKFLRGEKPDAVIAAMTHVGTAAFISQILARWQGKLLVRADGSRRYQNQGSLSLKQCGLFILQKYFFPKASAIIGVSTAIAREFREDFGLDNCHILHNPVATSVRGQGTITQPDHPFFTLNTPVIIAIGRLSKEKGFSFLLKVMALLRETLDVKLIILGEGQERRRLEKEIRDLGLTDHVSLPGFVRDPYAYLRRSSVYVLPSESESFGLSLVEALSTGIPVVSTDTEGPQDILNNDKLGERVPFGDVKRFAESIRQSLGLYDNNREERIARASDFSPPRIAAQYLRLIEHI